jgi:hypothetical protein
MLYYVKTGNIETLLRAESPRQAAMKMISINNRSDLGVCTIVSQKSIDQSNTNDQIYFLTENILEDCDSMRLVS